MVLADNTPAVLSDHVEDLLDTLLWRITEADGKLNTRYKTSGALACTDKSQLRHEHVFQRSKMIKALIGAKSDADAVGEILKNAIACVVTVDEHDYLRKFDDYYGWERYRKAGLIVMDTSEHPPQPRQAGEDP
jgi:hypothetical protein